MIRSEIVTMFRTENPEITDRVISDALLYEWLEIGNTEVACITRCIVGDFVFNSVVTTSVYDTKYDLTDKIPNFYDIDDFPGGGVSYDDDPLDKTTVSELDKEDSSWRTREASVPEKWYRRGKYLYFDYPIETADDEIRVYSILKPESFNDDVMPFNQLEHLEPYHYSLVLFLQKKAKMKVGKPGEEVKAQQEYNDYIKWMAKQIGGNKYAPVKIIGSSAYINNNTSR